MVDEAIVDKVIIEKRGFVMRKRLISVLLTICMVLALLPVLVLADADFIIENGALTQYNGSGGDVTIPAGVTSIGDGVFSNCYNLASVVIPDSVTSIGNNVFWGCKSLTSLTIPNSVTSIGNHVFWGCESLTSVIIPSSITNMGSGIFTDCNGLTSAGPIGGGYSYEFGWTDEIPENAFSFCPGLTSVIIPSSITSIGDNAFAYCTGLTSVTIPDGVTSIGALAFMGCSGLSSIKIPNGVTKIDGFTFSKCSGLTSVTIPNSVTQIYVGAFEDCTSLSSITIPKNVVSISEFAFAGCTTLTAIEVDEENVNFSSIDGVLIGTSWGGQLVAYPAGKQGAYTIPNNVTYIEQGAFFGCTGLTGVTIPSSVLYIEDEVFIGCSGLKSIQVNTGNPNYASIDGVLFTAAKDELIAYPAGKRGAYTIPDSVTRIWFDAFCGCSGLTSVIIPSRVTCIESLTFYGCTGLTSVIIPSSVTCIERSAFSGCTGLTSVNIPSSVNKIGSYAFHHCDALTDVYYGGSETQWKAIEIGSFNEKLTNATIHYGTMDPEPGPSGNGVIKSFYPSNGSRFDHASTTGDKAFHITFDREVKNAGGNRPELDFSAGTLKVHKAADDSVVYQVAESSFTSGTSTSVSLYGSTTPYTAVSISGITPELDYGTEYYVTMPAGFIKFADGTSSPAIVKGEWRFTTAEKKVIENLIETVEPSEVRGETFRHASSIKKNGEEVTNEYPFYYNDSWFMKSSYGEENYQHDLVKMSLCVAMAAYDSRELHRSSNIQELMRKIGYDHTIYGPVIPSDETEALSNTVVYNYPEPDTNSIGYAIGMKNLKNENGEDFTVILVAIRGGNYGIEWGGNFNVGSGKTHEGWSVAADKVMTGLSGYIVTNKDNMLPKVKVWVTGYSRGAATANLVAKRLDDGRITTINILPEDIYAFCFECPQNTREGNVTDPLYQNIISICNPIDFVTKLVMQRPTSTWGYDRYGRTLYLPYDLGGRNYPTLYNRMSGAHYYLTGEEALVEAPWQTLIL